MSMSMEKPLRGAVLRNGLVMLPREGQHGEAVADARPGLCPLCGLCHAPGHEALLSGAVELLRITLEAWTPLHKNDAVPMPLVIRKRLNKAREEYRRKAGRGGYINAENAEWRAMPQRLRMALLLLCAVDGDLPTLASREFQEMTPPERARIKAEVRIMKRLFGQPGRLVALASCW